MHDPTLFVAPTEPPELRRLGTTSSIPEHHGCDIVWTSTDGLVGIQRNEIADLWASLRDGRLARSAGLMRWLAVRVLLVEGRVRWSASGRLSTARSPLTREQFRGVLLSAQRRGLWVVHTDDLADTAAAALHLRAWAAKPRHVTFEGRPRAVEEPGSRPWALHLLQSFPSIGPATAGAIHDHFGHVPLSWSVAEAELAMVRGVGPVRASSLWSALAAPPRASSEAPRVARDIEVAGGAAAEDHEPGAAA
jgi:ERCC4-type nuclease